MAKDLSKIVKLDNDDYNINAVYSDEAGKVTNSLIVKESGTKALEFDGSTPNQIIDYVPADKGGTFKNPIYLSNPTNVPSDSEVITYEQVNGRIINLTGSPVCVWNTTGDYRMYELTDEDGSNYKLNTIVGTSQDFHILKKLITTGSNGLKFVVHNIVNNDYTNAWCSVSGVNKDLSVEEIDWDIIIPYAYTYTDNSGYKHKIPVTEIDSSAFDAYVYNNLTTSINKNIKSVVIPASITTIGNNAFRECSNLVSANIPSSVVSIGDAAFINCSKLQNLTISSTAANSLSGKSIFNACKALNSVIIPHGVKVIGYGTFSGCTNLTNIVIPTTVTTIEASAFSNCSSLSTGTVSYAGSDSDWEAITIKESASSNAPLLAARRVHYENTATAGIVDVVDVVKDPFIYVCRDIASGAGAQDTSSANDVYIKLPNDDNIVKISRGATRLDSVNNTASAQTYYTYESLAEIIARINTRLDGIGVGVDTTVLAPLLSVSAVNELVPDVEVTETFDPNSVPTVQQLEEAISKIQGKNIDNIAGIIDGCNDSLQELRNDLTDLEKEVFYNNAESEVYQTNTRIDDLEDGTTSAFVAQKLGTNKNTLTNKGSVNKPIYFSNGVPEECSSMVVNDNGYAGWKAGVDEAVASASVVAAWKNNVANDVSSIATIKATADAAKASAEQTASWKSTVEGDVSSIATIKATADAAGASIGMIVETGEDGNKSVKGSIIINAINDTSNATINADRINLKGAVTFDSLNAEVQGKLNATGGNGLTPYIGNNGNWWIGTTDTGVKAGGSDGVSVTKVVTQYCVSADKTTAPTTGWNEDFDKTLDNYYSYKKNNSSTTYYIWAREKIEFSAGDPKYSAPTVNSASSFIASWCDTNDKTKIHGSNIATGTITADQIDTDTLKIGENIFMAENATISWNNISDKPTIPAGVTDEYITNISKNAITSEYIKNLNLEVGNQIQMASNAKISWDNLPTDAAKKSDIPEGVTDEYITNITKDTVTTSYVNALGVTANEAEISKKLLVIKDGYTLLEADTNSKKVNIGKFTVGTYNKDNTDISYLTTGKSIYNDNKAGVYLGTDGIGLGQGKFYVDKAGAMTSVSGKVGGWDIAEKKIYSGDVLLNADDTVTYDSLVSDSTSPVRFSAGGTITTEENKRTWSGTKYIYVPIQECNIIRPECGLGSLTSLTVSQIQVFNLAAGWGISNFTDYSYTVDYTNNQFTVTCSSETCAKLLNEGYSHLLVFHNYSWEYLISEARTSPAFEVLADGSLYASAADISGKIYATAGGQIGPFALTADGLNSAFVKINEKEIYFPVQSQLNLNDSVRLYTDTTTGDSYLSTVNSRDFTIKNASGAGIKFYKDTEAVTNIVTLTVNGPSRCNTANDIGAYGDGIDWEGFRDNPSIEFSAELSSPLPFAYSKDVYVKYVSNLNGTYSLADYHTQRFTVKFDPFETKTTVRVYLESYRDQNSTYYCPKAENISTGISFNSSSVSKLNELSYRVHSYSSTNNVLYSLGNFNPDKDGKLSLGANGKAWGNMYLYTGTQVGSDIKLKNTIESLSENYETFFAGLKPVSYILNDGQSGRKHVGFIAQDVEQSLSSANIDTKDFAGLCIPREGESYYMLRYEEFIALNTHMIQKLKKENAALKESNEALEARLAAIEEKLNSL